MDWKIMLTQFLTAILVALAPVLVGLLAAWVRLKYMEFRRKMELDHKDILTELDFLASIAVKAAEQSKLAGLIEDKKDYAIDLLEQYLYDHGYPVDLGLIDAAIEAAVYAEFHKPDAEQ